MKSKVRRVENVRGMVDLTKSLSKSESERARRMICSVRERDQDCTKSD